VKPILKNVVDNWYGEITLKILKEKPINSITIKPHLHFSIMYPLGIEIFINTKEIHFKKKDSILTFQKVITTIW
jgi:hypothetical protein